MDYIKHILEFFGQYPMVAAGAIGSALSMLATQSIKRALPDEWSDRKYRLTVQAIGFVTGWWFTYGAWRLFDPSSSNFERLYASAGAGFASPAIYSFVSSYVMHKFTWFDEKFSGRPKDNPK